MHWIDFNSFFVARNISNLSHKIWCQSNHTDNKSTWKHNAFEFSVLLTRYDFSRSHTSVGFFSFICESRGARDTCNSLVKHLFLCCFARASKNELKNSGSEREGKKQWNKQWTNHQRGDLLAAIRNHSSFGQVCNGKRMRHVNYWRKQSFRVRFFYWTDCILFG